MDGPAAAPRVKPRRLHWFVFAVLAACTGILDLWTKQAIFDLLRVRIEQVPIDGVLRAVIGEHQKVVIIPNFFELEPNINYGAFSGWFSRHTGLLTLLSAVALGVIVWFLWSYLRGPGPHRLWVTAGLGLVWGGTLGNLYDRGIHGYVRDFIKWFVVKEDGRELVWPNFNLADSAICVGVAIILVLFPRSSRRSEPAGAHAPT